MKNQTKLIKPSSKLIYNRIKMCISLIEKANSSHKINNKFNNRKEAQSQIPSFINHNIYRLFKFNYDIIIISCIYHLTSCQPTQLFVKFIFKYLHAKRYTYRVP